MNENAVRSFKAKICFFLNRKLNYVFSYICSFELIEGVPHTFLIENLNDFEYAQVNNFVGKIFQSIAII